MKVEQDLTEGIVTLSQKTYFEAVIEEFNLGHLPIRSTPLPVGLHLDSSMCPQNDAERREMADKPYRPLLGKVMWGQLATRPDLSFAVSLLSRFQTNPGINHWRELLHVMGYIKGSLDLALVYRRGAQLKPIGYVDAD